MKLWLLALTALAASLAGAGIAVGVMALWEPWEGEGEVRQEPVSSHVDRLAQCGRTYLSDSPGLDECSFFAGINIAAWECLVEYYDVANAKDACRSEAFKSMSKDQRVAVCNQIYRRALENTFQEELDRCIEAVATDDYGAWDCMVSSFPDPRTTC